MNETKYYPKEYKQLDEIYHANGETKLCIVTGNLGVGKSTLIKQFLHTLPQKKILLKETADDIDIYYSIKKVIENNRNIRYNIPMETSSDILYTTEITSDFVSLCQNHPNSCLWIDDISTFKDIKSLQNIYEIIKILLYLKSQLNIFIIIECSKDKLTDDSRSVYYDIRSLIQTDNIIELEKLENNMLIHYFKDLFRQPISISAPMIMRICKSAFYNLFFIKQYVEYLKDHQIIYQQEGVWYCGDIDTSISYSLLRQPIQKRYDKLDNGLQKVLQKASVTGKEINIKLMKHPLLVINPEQKLNAIEKISHLVETEYNSYFFETDEVYCHIKDSLDDDRMIELHKLLAEHLHNDISIKTYEDNIYESRRKSYEIAKHYEYCGEFEKSFKFYTICISYSRRINDFDSVKKCCKRAFQVGELIHVDKYYQQFLYWNLALAYEKLSKFTLAAENYEMATEYLGAAPPMYDELKISYHYGYCLRRSGNTDKAYSHLDELRKKLIHKSSDEHRQLLVQTLIVLIGILDQIGKIELKERYFNHCLTLSQHLENKSLYNELLTKSTLYYNSQIATPMMSEAFHYFEAHNQRFETAKAAFNLGMNEIYCFDLISAKQHITYSYEIFSTYGGNNICYPACALGILEALDENYINAIKYFEHVQHFATNDFARVTAYINLCHCYRKIKNYNLAFEKLETANIILKQNSNDKLVLVRNYYFAKAMMVYDIPNSDSDVGLSLIEKALNTELNKLGYHTYNIYFAKWIVRLSTQLHKESPALDIVNMASKPLTKYKQTCYEQNVIWGNFMFW